jgi:hypothetical protein
MTRREQGDGGAKHPSPFDLRSPVTKTLSFDKLRMRFSTAVAYAMVLILSLSKDEDHAPRLDVDRL